MSIKSLLMFKEVKHVSGKMHWYYVLIMSLLIGSAAVTLSYSGLSIYIATQLIYAPQLAINRTPAALGLQYRNVTFSSRGDNIRLQGWFIPGITQAGKLTTYRTIIMVHGARENRAEDVHGVLDLSGAMVHHGFAVLAFDMRGNGASPAAPFSAGYFEQRDVLGAVDFLRSGSLPYPELGRTHTIGGWGVSMGAATLLLAAAHEPALRALVSDCAFADILPILEREVPATGHVPQVMTPGALVAAQVLYGVDFYHVRPVDVVASIAPRPILFIHGAADSYIPSSNMNILATAARKAINAHIQTLLVPRADHAQSYHALKGAYVSRLVEFYTLALGQDMSMSVY